MLSLARDRRWISVRLALAMATVALAGSACAAATAQPRIPGEIQLPAPREPADSGATLAQRSIELPAEALKSGACTAEDWRQIRSLRSKAFVSFYVVGPLISGVTNGFLYRVDRRMNPWDWGASIGAGSLVGIGFGASFLSRANSVQLACTFPR